LKISRACSCFFVTVHVSAPYATIGLISVYSIIALQNMGQNIIFLPHQT
jgi:hypothetical protein